MRDASLAAGKGRMGPEASRPVGLPLGPWGCLGLTRTKVGLRRAALGPSAFDSGVGDSREWWRQIAVCAKQVGEHQRVLVSPDRHAFEPIQSCDQGMGQQHDRASSAGTGNRPQRSGGHRLAESTFYAPRLVWAAKAPLKAIHNARERLESWLTEAGS